MASEATVHVVREVSKKAKQSDLPHEDEELRDDLEAATRGESFKQHVAREGPAVAMQVHREAVEAGSTEAAKEASELVAKDAQVIDELDEAQIAEEMAGRVITQYFYEFENRGRKITGIAIAGVKAVAREMALRGEAITVPELQVQDGEDSDGPYVGVLAKVRNLRTGEERFAWASQSTTMRLRTGERIPDPFAKTKAINKAQRNGLRWFIPEVVVIEMFKAWKEGATQPAAIKQGVSRALPGART